MTVFIITSDKYHFQIKVKTSHTGLYYLIKVLMLSEEFETH